MAMGIGLRTLWINLRAMNYTDRAFRAAQKNVENLDKTEKARLKTLLDQRTEIMANISTGMLYSAMGYMMAGAIGNIVSETQAGAQVMSEFKDIIQDVKGAFADTFFVILQPALEVLRGFLVLIRDNAPLRFLISLLLIGATVLLTVAGAYKILSGAIAIYRNNQEIASLFAAVSARIHKIQAASVAATSSAYRMLAVSIGLVLAGFTIFMILGEVIGREKGAIVAGIIAITMAVLALAVALNMLSLGALTPLQLGAVAVGAGVAAGVMAIGNYQTGTRGLPHTGLFYGHKGEVVYNPHTERPTGVMPTFEEKPSTTYYDIPIRIENVHTKAEYDDLEDALSVALRKAGRRRR